MTKEEELSWAVEVLTRVKRREGCTYVCEIPQEFGSVTKIEVKRGKVVVRTGKGWDIQAVPQSAP